MVNVQLDRDIVDILRSKKIGEDTYNDVLRRIFKELDNRKMPLVDKDEVK